MASRANPKKKAASAKGKVPSRGRMATLPKTKKGKKRGIGDNSGIHAVPDETILRAIETLRTKKRAMKKVQEEFDQVKGVYRSARKKAKADGLNMDAFDLIEALENQDQGSVLINHADAGRYLKLTESPLALQMELFQNLSAPAPKVDANLQGQQAGKNAEDAENNPFQAGSEDFVAWAEGWATGQQMNAEKIGKSGAQTLQ